MKKKLTTVVFRGTPEQEEKLIAVIDKYNGVKGALMPILQEAQAIYGYLPVEVQKIIAQRTGTPIELIYGVVSFYAQFKSVQRPCTACCRNIIQHTERIF